MSGEIFAGGAWREIADAQVCVSGQWRPVLYAEAFIGGEWREVLRFSSPLTVSVSPTTARGSRVTDRPSPGVVTSNIVTATPLGGTAPYTYAWTASSGLTALSPNLAQTAFRGSVPPEDFLLGEATVTVTDSLGVTGTAAVTVTLTNSSLA